jgi:RNA polymerase sigma-70 factor (ECF subfamily)
MPETDSFAAEPRDLALERLMDEEGGRMYGLGMKLCGNSEEAEDLVQETFLQAFRKWDQFEGRSAPSSWLYTIAARICQRRNRLRSGEPARVESLSELLPSGQPMVATLPSSEESQLDEQLRREAQERVDQALANLPIHLRLPLLLKDITELSLSQIADILGLKEATVKTRVHRGRLALRKELADSLPQREAPPPDHSQKVCLDLLSAKQEALDRGVEFPVPPDELCSRCKSVMSTLDLTFDACRQLDLESLPESLRQSILRETSNL